ncbi:MAG: C25 family cysteine peptidase [Candidatus Thermoplasmatota archaeon]|nr:C25 family cysteine peptidase [Candidatus Thermoplasmatota archaeon]
MLAKIVRLMLGKKDNGKTVPKIGAILIVLMLLSLGLYLLLQGEDGDNNLIIADVNVPADYVIFIDEPTNEYEMLLAAGASMLAYRDLYRPLFFLEGEDINWHQMCTLQNMTVKGNTPLYFTFKNDLEAAPPRIASFGPPQIIHLSKETLMGLTGFEGQITVSSYEEALWAAPVAHAQGKKIVPGARTFTNQEQAWEALLDMEIGPNYVIATNPEDYRTDIFWTNGLMMKDNNGDPLPQPLPYNATFHIPRLSLMTIQLACAHNGWVMTQITPSTEWLVDIDSDINGIAIGYYNGLKYIQDNYGPIEYVCLVGSGEAVPQFELEMSGEGDGMVSADVIYGFLTDDQYYMSAAVGRIVNRNLAGASNQISRTLGYDYYVETVTAEYTTGTQTVNWRSHASVWNGFEVADQRRQMNAGRYATIDLEEEGYTYDYLQTSGTSAPLSQNRLQEDWKPVMEASGLVTYRGHGSWHATFYVYKPETPSDPMSRSRLEGNDLERYAQYENSPSVVMYNLPPQVGILISCENAKISGCHYWGQPVDMDMLWATNYLYSGAVGLIAATEVSYSNIGQDIWNKGVLITDNGNWDMNNCWYAFPLDALINHEEKHGTIGKAHQWAENRYIHNPNKDTMLSPFEAGLGSADWKEITMFVCYGDPAFRPYSPSPGDGGFDPWHNGPGEGDQF